MIIDVGKRMLERLGYETLTASNGAEALEIYKSRGKDISLVILDMVMPKIGGGETFDRLKKINPAINVILCSGYSIDGQATEILKRGCRAFIQKPFNLKSLSQHIRTVLDSNEPN
jgi:CheY-like chemotaxis protein